MTYFSGRRAAMILEAAAKRASFVPAIDSGMGNAEFWRRRRDLRSRFTRGEDAFFSHFASQFGKFEARVAEVLPNWAPAWADRCSNGAINYDTRVLAGALAAPEDVALDGVLRSLARRGSLAPALLELTSAGYFCQETQQDAGLSRDEVVEFIRRAHQKREVAAMPVFRKVICAACGATNLGLQEECMLCRAPLPALQADAAPHPEPPAPVEPLVAAQPQASPPVAPAALCSRCGAQLPPGVRFCVECGTPVEAPAPQQASTRACGNCGAELPAGSRFCVNCGTPAA
jgi:hypothetical protein